MAEPLKNHFSTNVPEQLAQHIKQVYPSFDVQGFLTSALHGFEQLELMQRGKKLAQDLNAFLPADFSEAAQILMDSMSIPLSHTNYLPMQSFFYMPHLNYVALFGLKDPETALSALKSMTTKFSAEFAIRPFIERYPDFVFEKLHEWKHDSNVHVRRLVSEGTRPLLPWASRLTALQQNPHPVLPLLEHLKDDADLYVRRSVANHLNDITKTHPELVLDLCERWLKKTEDHIQWIVKQALRTLIKKGNSKAIQLLGFGTSERIEILNTSLAPTVVYLNNSVETSITLFNQGDTEQRLLIDYAIHFMKANGKTQKKVFKGFDTTLLPQETRTFVKTHRFQQLTTRKHYEGQHSFEFLINGKPHPIGEFFLRL